MGLTIHYGLKFNGKSERTALARVEKMRQLALDLPFETVGEVVVRVGREADFQDPKYDDPQYAGAVDELLGATAHIFCPWNQHLGRTIKPERVISFSIFPGWGSENLVLGLACYPKIIAWEYSPQDDEKFLIDVKTGNATHFGAEFDYPKFKRHCKRLTQKRGEYVPWTPYADCHREQRFVKTRLSGWSWKAFCKTQYASDPDCGGMPNFVKCHVATIVLLEKIAKLPGMHLDLDDEGHYGPSNYSDDWQEAYAAGRKPTYVDHEGTYSIKTLIEQVGDYNQLVAATFGAIKETVASVGLEAESPITHFSNFEELEFRATQNENIKDFLGVLDRMAKASRKA